MKSALVLFFHFLLSCALFAQADSVQLPLVTVSETRNSLYSIGNHKQLADSAFLAQNPAYSLADLASKHTAIFVNAYGPGLLNTATARGMGSGHTAVLWNGFNIQGSMNGVVDFSLVPAGLFERISIDYGSSGALFGSGAVGSAVYLDSRKKVRQGWHGNVLAGAGSFGNLHQQAGLQYGNAKLSSSLSIIHTKADNDFEYVYNHTSGRQSNSAFKQFALHQDNNFQIAGNQFIKTFIWFQNTDRQLPPSATEGQSDAIQKDRSFRAGLEWTLFKNKASFKTRSAYFDEYLLYSSSLIEPSVSYTKTFIAEFENTLELPGNQSLNTGLHYTFDHADSNVFDSIKRRNRVAAFVNWKATYFKQKGILAASLRQEYAAGKFVPLTPAAGTEISLSKAFSVKAKASGMYKLPNFNDMYWPQTGNPDLLPESGWSAESGLEYKTPLQNWNLKAQATGFNGLIKNWILWSPINGIWTPSNQRSVWSRGFSCGLTLASEGKVLGLESSLNYEFTKATIHQPDDATEIENAGKQLIYTPLHQAKASLVLRYKSAGISYFHVFTGERYTTTDNSQTVAAYNTGDVVLSWSFRLVKLRSGINFRVNNIWDKSYTVLPARPMPMRNYSLDLRIDF